MTDRGRTAGKRSAAQIAADLELLPHPEGGRFREIYRAQARLQTPAGTRSLATLIWFLIEEGDPSRFHRLGSDELWLFHDGFPLELFLLRDADSAAERRVIDVDHREALVPAMTWAAAKVMGSKNVSATWSLVTCLVAPGFQYEDFELAEREALQAQFPGARDLIASLT